MKWLILHTYFRVACIALLAVAPGFGVAQARETYVQYAERIIANPPGGAEVRSDLEAAVLRATNAWRSSKRLPPLKPAKGVLQVAARAHAMDLLSMGVMGHTSSTGHDFGSRMRAFKPGQMFLAAMGENAARLRKSKLSDSEKAQALVAQWVKSSSHRKTMGDRTYVAMAVGVVSLGDTVYAVQIFTGPEVKTNMGLIGNSQP
jgi:uncharacterized protein YkwD